LTSFLRYWLGACSKPFERDAKERQVDELQAGIEPVYRVCRSMPESFLPASLPFEAAVFVFFTRCASTIRNVPRALRPCASRAAPTWFFYVCSSESPPSRGLLQMAKHEGIARHFENSWGSYAPLAAAPEQMPHRTGASCKSTRRGLVFLRALSNDALMNSN
jgi:hypothetical protein